MLKRRAFLGIGLAMLLAMAAHATTLVQMSLDELTAAAQVVARVRCIENQTRVDGNEIWTFTRFEVRETLKGNAPREVTVRLLGGQLGSLQARVEGVPRFQPGEEAYLFLEPTRSGDLSVTSWVQGTFRVRREPGTQRELVTQDSSSVTVFDPATQKLRAGGVRNLAAGQFRQLVREAVERTEKRP